MIINDTVVMSDVVVESIDPASEEAIAWSSALWAEVQHRYDFVAPDPYEPARFATPGSAFWVARIGDSEAGSIALARSAQSTVAELDEYYGPSYADGLYRNPVA